MAGLWMLFLLRLCSPSDVALLSHTHQFFSPLWLSPVLEAHLVGLVRNFVLTHDISAKCFVLSVGLFHFPNGLSF